MLVDLDLDDLWYLLDACLRGSHLRTLTIDRYVDCYWERFTEQQRYTLYEWTLRLTYNGHFKASETSCGSDVVFMKRYDPENQYMVHYKYNGETNTMRAFLMNGTYHIGVNRFIAPEYILSVDKFVPQVERTVFELATKEGRS